MRFHEQWIATSNYYVNFTTTTILNVQDEYSPDLLYLDLGAKSMFPSSPEEVLHGVVRARGAAASNDSGNTHRLLAAFHIREALPHDWFWLRSCKVVGSSQIQNP